VTEDEALARLDAILARPEYRSYGQSLLERWRDALLDWLYNQLVGAWRTLSEAATGREGVANLIGVVVLAALLAAGLVVLVRAIRLSVVGDARLSAADTAARRRRSDELWREANRLAAAGEFDQAARRAYLSALYALDERALLEVQVGSTNREHAERLGASHPELGDAFGRLVGAYDRLRYGQVAVDAAAFADLRGLAERARAAA
jgi:Domain of unknown function (DUF4129)